MGKFKIVWIDDNSEQKCKKEQKQIEKLINGIGLESDIHYIKKISKDDLLNPGSELHDTLVSRDYDLLIIDYNLSDDLLGGEVIYQMRTSFHIYTDIIFYSSMKGDFINSIKKSFDEVSSLSYWDDVSIAPLDEDFITKVERVINKIVESWYRVHAIRGVILSKASKFEGMINEIINQNYKSALTEIKNALELKGNNIKSSLKGKWEKVNKTDDPVPLIINDPINFNWAVKKEIFDLLLEKGIIENNTNLVNSLYNLFKLRNDFAHNVVKIKEGVCCLQKNNSEVRYDTNKIKEIRNEIKNLNQYLDSLLN